MLSSTPYRAQWTLNAVQTRKFIININLRGEAFAFIVLWLACAGDRSDVTTLRRRTVAFAHSTLALTSANRPGEENRSPQVPG